MDANKIDLSACSIPDLNRLQARIEAELRRREENVRKQLIKQMEKMAAEQGFALSDLVSHSGGRKNGTSNKLAGIKIPPKYRHPANPELEWTGRGRAPHWVEHWREEHGSLDGILIRNQPQQA